MRFLIKRSVCGEKRVAHSLATDWIWEIQFICPRFPFAIKPQFQKSCDCGLEVVVSGVGGNDFRCRRQRVWASTVMDLGVSLSLLFCSSLQ